MNPKEKVLEIIKRLTPEWPNPKMELNHSNSLELLIATMLSAQTTDKTVNTVTPELFSTYKTVDAYADADVNDIYRMVRKVNFSSTKAKNIKKMAELLVTRFNGQVPQNMDDLLTLPGVARKTANVVLGDAFGKSEGIVVDTHVIRLSQWLGLSKETKPEKIEKDLMLIVPKKDWIRFPHLLILYGRYKCGAKMNRNECPILTDLFVNV